MSNRVLVMDNGKIICDGPPQDVGESMKRKEHTMFLAMPRRCGSTRLCRLISSARLPSGKAGCGWTNLPAVMSFAALKAMLRRQPQYRLMIRP